MTKWILALLLLLLMSPASAQEDLATDSILRIHCDASKSALMLTTDPAATWRPGMAMESIDVGNLIEVSEEDARGDIRRLGTATVGRTCGQLSIRISGGYFNSNPQGEMGAASDVPVVEIFNGDARIAGPLAIGVCDATHGRYNGIAECPAHWATKVQIIELDGHISMYLNHEYEEWLSP